MLHLEPSNESNIPVCDENNHHAVYRSKKTPLKMEVLDKPKCIKIGNYYSYFPDLYHYSESKLSRKCNILSANNIDLPHYIHNHENPYYEELVSSIKYYHKAYADLMGARFNSRFQKLTYALWVGSDAKLIHKFCHSGKSLSGGLVYRFHAFRELILEAVINKEPHLVPALLFFGKPINIIKDLVGSHTWKLICKNSLSRNSLIFNALYYSMDRPAQKGVVCYEATSHRRPKISSVVQETFMPYLNRLLQLPSSVLSTNIIHSQLIHHPRRTHIDIIDGFVWACNEVRKIRKLTDREYVIDMWTLYRDTSRMAERLEVPFSETWSHRRMVREHNKLSLDIEKLNYPRKFEIYNFKFPWHQIMNWQGINITLLNSPYALAKEGAEMHHCVASYHEYVFSGKSIIFALSNSQGDRSTLELACDHSTLRIAQHRSKYNGPVSEEFKLAADYVLSEQSKIFKSEMNSKYLYER